jgi:hypothetical protein
MTDRDDTMAVAREVIAVCDGDPLDFLEKKIEEAESYRDGERVTKWLRVRQAVHELLQRGDSTADGPAGSDQQEQQRTARRSSTGRPRGH